MVKLRHNRATMQNEETCSDPSACYEIGGHLVTVGRDATGVPIQLGFCDNHYLIWRNKGGY